eukprot:scaffold119139_cov36-Tisochrysis_lutea.AAC.2
MTCPRPSTAGRWHCRLSSPIVPSALCLVGEFAGECPGIHSSGNLLDPNHACTCPFRGQHVAHCSDLVFREGEHLITGLHGKCFRRGDVRLPVGPGQLVGQPCRDVTSFSLCECFI